MPTHFDSREKPRKWKSDQRPGPSGPERQVPQIFSFQLNLDSRDKPSLWTRVSDALSDNGLDMTRCCSLEASVITSLLPLLDEIR